ncbi:MAG: homoserine O-succinyltransferase, partial [Oscillospiraceae bacterium]|nr:homoserine O-succinyltransferase [Oscillospiraceae bacterium]
LADSAEAGVYAVMTEGGRQVFITGHPEYDEDTLAGEYTRDVAAQGANANMPTNYFQNNDPSLSPIVTWRGSANLLYSNWLNYFVYQSTPYDIQAINNKGRA